MNSSMRLYVFVSTRLSIQSGDNLATVSRGAEDLATMLSRVTATSAAATPMSSVGMFGFGRADAAREAGAILLQKRAAPPAGAAPAQHRLAAAQVRAINTGPQSYTSRIMSTPLHAWAYAALHNHTSKTLSTERNAPENADRDARGRKTAPTRDCQLERRHAHRATQPINPDCRRDALASRDATDARHVSRHETHGLAVNRFALTANTAPA